MPAPSGTQARKGVVMMPSVSWQDLSTLSSKTSARADASASPCPGDGLSAAFCHGLKSLEGP
jgi:hypothetical protein